MNIEDKKILQDSDLNFARYVLNQMVENNLDIETLLDDMYKYDSEEYRKAYVKLSNFLGIEVGS